MIPTEYFQAYNFKEINHVILDNLMRCDMSRTYRRKNYEDTQGNSWDRKGRKTDGFYTKCNISWYSWSSWNFEELMFRPMTKEERFYSWYWAHGESRDANERTPSRWYRKNRQKQNRMINKKEIVQWIKAGGEYEPMCEPNPRSHLWDWS